MATPAHTESMPARRVAEPGTANAIDLGWRVAALHALSPSKLSPPAAAHDDLLLNRLSLDAVDRLELDLLAIAGVARSIGAPLADDELEALLDLIPAAASSHDGEERFRGALVRTHIAFEKRMWAKDEGLGRAYELGNFISDTWNRLLRPRTTPDARAELFEIFRSDRVQRMKVLLDNLQTRLDPTAVHVVASHLDAWRDRVAERRETGIPPDATYDPVERQTIIWRQILTGDKEPEAYIDRDRRSQVRDELSRELWQRYRRRWWVVPLVAALGGAIGYLLANDSSVAAALIGTLTATGGVLGAARASMIASVRRGLQAWGELVWSRSLAAVICRDTLLVDELLPRSDEAAGAAV